MSQYMHHPKDKAEVGLQHESHSIQTQLTEVGASMAQDSRMTNMESTQTVYSWLKGKIVEHLDTRDGGDGDKKERNLDEQTTPSTSDPTSVIAPPGWVMSVAKAFSVLPLKANDLWKRALIKANQ